MADNTIKEYKIIGVMSGTSLDGLDLANCRFWEENGKWKYEIHNTEFIPYSSQWKEKLKNAPLLDGYSLSILDREFGNYIGERCLDFIKKYIIKPGYISSHGHTVFHNPAQKLTVQIGHGPSITAKTKLPVICDFRTMDVAAGGQGAPLVPVGDRMLFHEYDVCLNLGGIANFSFEKEGKRVAYDICPCNIILNAIALQAGKEYDANGEIASKGKPDNIWLEKLEKWRHYSSPAPKSLHKEELMQFWNAFLECDLNIADKMATASAHIANRINVEIGIAEIKNGKVLVTGGGAFNKILINNLRLQNGMQYILPSDELVNFKEALIFGFLGLLRILERPNCLLSVTGAEHDTIGGAVYIVPAS